MIELSLYSVPVDSSVNVTMGRCIDRTRFDKEAMGTSVMEMVKGLLKSNMSEIDPALKNDGITDFINGDQTMTTTDFACINYWLAKAGFLVTIQNVADDEDNPTAVSPGEAEWNIVDYNFIQHDYPTAVKIIPADGMDVVEILRKITEQTNLFDTNKLGNTKNPLKIAVDQLEKVKKFMGNIEPGLSTKVYDILSQVGIKVFLAVG